MSDTRRLLMVSCTDDWTEHTPQVEYPAMRKFYSLFMKEDLEPDDNTPNQLQYIQVHEEHNYNRESREAAYNFFARWLQNQQQPTLKEIPFRVEKAEDLSVFMTLPPGAMNRTQLTEWLVNRAKQSLPRDPANIFGKTFLAFGTIFPPESESTSECHQPFSVQIGNASGWKIG